MSNIQVESYTGNQPYIFISYSHKDKERVQPYIARLNQDCYRIWFDSYIEAGTAWAKTIAEHLSASSCLISFITDNYLNSENCLDEIEYAKDNKIPTLIIYLDDLDLPQEFKMRHNRTQAIFSGQYSTEDELFGRVYEATILQDCKDATGVLTEPGTTAIDIIDENYISYMINSEEDDDFCSLKKRYFTVNGRANTVMKAVCCNLCVTNKDIVSKLLLLSLGKNKVSFLMADGGTGKTTLLCQVALYSHSQNINTLYVNLENQINESDFIDELIRNLSESQVEKTLLIIDNPKINSHLINELYKFLNNRSFKSLYQNLYVLIGDRTENIISLLSSSDTVFDNWIFKSTPIYLSNLSASDSNNTYVESQIFLEKTKRIVLPIKYKKNIIKNLVNNISNLFELDLDMLLKASQDVNYNDSITSILVNIELKYNELAKQNQIPAGRYVKWDWELWNEKTIELDKYCSSIPISETFKYIAALGVLGIRMTLDTLNNIVELRNLSKLDDIFPAKTYIPVCIANNKIQLKHDTVAQNYFFVNKHIDIQKCICEIVRNHWLSENDFILFSKYIFHSSRFIESTIVPEGINLFEIISLLNTDNEYVTQIEKNGKLSSLELSRITLEKATTKNYDIELAINKSYEYLQSKLSDDYYSAFWKKYLIMALYNCEQLPECFLNFETEPECKKITSNLQIIRRTKSILKDEVIKNKLEKWSIILLKKIAELYPSDSVSILALGDIYEERLEFEQARTIYKNYLAANENNPLSTLNLYTKIIKNYRLEIDSINQTISRYTKKAETQYGTYLNTTTKNIDARKKRKRNVQKNMLSEYKFVANKLKTFVSNSNEEDFNTIAIYYVSVYSEYAHECIKFKQYDEAYNLLNEIPNNYPEIFRKYTVLGYLFQNQYNDSKNKYADIEKTIDCCQKALSCIENYKDDKSKKRQSIPLLIILAKTYDINNQKDDAIAVSKIINRLDRGNKIALEIFNKYGHKESYTINQQSKSLECYFEYEYLEEDDTIKITRCHPNKNACITVPSKIDDKLVTVIGDSCFEEEDFKHCIEEVTLPDTITSIGEDAFAGCSLLSAISIPDTVLDIGAFAFKDCKSLCSIKLPSKLTTIKRGTFMFCDSLKEAVLPFGIKEIKEKAFIRCPLESLFIPASIENIEAGAFARCDRKCIRFNGSINDDWFI